MFCDSFEHDIIVKCPVICLGKIVNISVPINRFSWCDYNILKLIYSMDDGRHNFLYHSISVYGHMFCYFVRVFFTHKNLPCIGFDNPLSTHGRLHFHLSQSKHWWAGVSANQREITPQCCCQ